MNISVLGWYGNHNIGDEAYKLSFPLLFPGHALTFGDSFVPQDTDLLIVGGGDVLHHSYLDKTYGFNGRKIALSVSATVRSRFESMEDFSHVYVRDISSYKIASDYLPAEKVSLLPDATFLLQPNPDRGREIIASRFKEEGCQLYSRVVVVVVNGHLLHNTSNALARDYMAFQHFSESLARIIDHSGASFVFLPFGTKRPVDDRVANGWVDSRTKFWKKNVTFYDRLGVQDTLNVVSAADVVMSTRLHSTIFSTISNVPFIDIIHHNKNRGFVETLGVEEWMLDYWKFDECGCKELLDGHLNKEFMSSNPQQYSSRAKEDLANAVIL